MSFKYSLYDSHPQINVYPSICVGECSLHGSLRISSSPSSGGVLLQRLKLEIGDDPSATDALHILGGSTVVLENCLVEAMANTAVYVGGAEHNQPTSLTMRHCILGRQDK